jgi:hypothetical protein
MAYAYYTHDDEELNILNNKPLKIKKIILINI